VAKKKQPAALPSRQDILNYIAENPGKVGKREIARAFNVGAEHRVALKGLLRELKAAGDISQTHGRKVTPKDQLPEVTLVDLVKLDRHGDLVGRPVEWKGSGESPRILFEGRRKSRRETSEVGVGDRVLARLERAGRNRYRGRIIKKP
jgi:ribonuclease R